MVAHGTGDDNVHFANTALILNKLIEADEYPELMIFPGRGHPIGDRAAQVELFNRIEQFLLNNLVRPNEPVNFTRYAARARRKILHSTMAMKSSGRFLALPIGLAGLCVAARALPGPARSSAATGNHARHAGTTKDRAGNAQRAVARIRFQSHVPPEIYRGAHRDRRLSESASERRARQSR